MNQLDDLPGGKAVATRYLAHNTTVVLKLVEAYGKPVAITNHNVVIAAIIPTTSSEFVSGWLRRRPAFAGKLEAAMDSWAEAESEPTDDFFSRMPPKGSAKAPRSTPTEVGVRDFSKSTSQLLRSVEQGSVVLVRRNKLMIAAIVPCSRGQFAQLVLSWTPGFAAHIADLSEKAKDLATTYSFGEAFEVTDLNPPIR